MRRSGNLIWQSRPNIKLALVWCVFTFPMSAPIFESINVLWIAANLERRHTPARMYTVLVWFGLFIWGIHLDRLHTIPGMQNNDLRPIAALHTSIDKFPNTTRSLAPNLQCSSMTLVSESGMMVWVIRYGFGTWTTVCIAARERVCVLLQWIMSARSYWQNFNTPLMRVLPLFTPCTVQC